ncbi:hypothetical protein FLCU109888_11490 [Flavobacterium cucumis]|uniref:Uncharacterized protein n=1 Tax=Flavobacterium cucumis TaxID=416016 RepID=A0A1M7ZVG0_9FLAO|nr:hypothetical protein [Flavobacterium cucumis]SHO72874.1 hypothetical protein SAMN05443547_1218 [Flavobacterium cucumis]
MTLEPVNDFFSNIKEKLTNPFFSTLIFVWLVRNWELVYSIFNFDECYTLETKKQFIVSYYRDKTIVEELFINIGIALLLMLLGYIMLFLTRTFTTWFDFSLMPSVTGKVITSKVVQRELYDEVFKERNEYAEKYEEQRKLVRDSSKEYDEITKNYQVQSSTVSVLTTKVNELTSENAQNMTEINRLTINETNLTNEIKRIKNDNSNLLDFKGFQEVQNYQYLQIISHYRPVQTKEHLPKIVKELYDNLVKNGLLNEFYSVAQFLTNGGDVATKKIERMVELKAVYKFKNSNEYRLTPSGNFLYINWVVLVGVG